MKRNFKLITTFASIIIVLCVMAIGVWAATTHSLSISTRVSFTAVGFKGTIYGTLDGLTDATQYYSQAEPYEILVGDTTLPAWEQSATRAVADSDNNGIPDSIIYEVFITSDVPSSAVISLSNITYSSEFSILIESKVDAGSYTTKTITGSSPTASCNLGQILANGTFQFKITYQILDCSKDISSATFVFDTLIERI